MRDFKNYNIVISEKDSEVIKNYLEKIAEYVEKHNLDKELYSDIEEGIFEKLEEISDVKNKDVMKIINEMGEPEDIFDLDESSIKREIDFASTIGKGAKTAKVASNKLMNFVSEKSPNLGEKISLGFKKLYDFIKMIFGKIWGLIMFFIKNFFKIIKFIFDKFSAIIGFFIAFIGFIIGTSFILAMNSEFTLNNVEYFGFIPDNLKFAGIALSIGFIILGTGLIIKKLFNPFVVLGIAGSIGVSIVLVLFTGFNITSEYSFTGEKVEKIVLESGDDNIALLEKIEESDSFFESFFFIRDSYYIPVRESKDDKVRINIKTEIFGSSEEDVENKKKILNNFILEGDTLTVKEGKIFTEKTTYFPFIRSFEIEIPKGKSLDVKSLEFWKYYFGTNCSNGRSGHHTYYSHKIIQNNNGEICEKEKSAE